jgi:hypothetical protein
MAVVSLCHLTHEPSFVAPNRPLLFKACVYAVRFDMDTDCRSDQHAPITLSAIALVHSHEPVHYGTLRSPLCLVLLLDASEKNPHDNRT